jgi:UDP-N-acetyl-2-amino-2-deoxyglucuronate dehydrogenase
LRLNPVLQGIRCEVEQNGKYHEVEIQYCTPRGKWYYSAWKGNENLSGGIQTNIGVHLFDLCQWIWGPVEDIQLKTKTDREVSGELFLKRAHIAFTLSIEGLSSNRSMKIDGREIEFSQGFGDAHTRSYQKVLAGEGFGLADALPSIVLCEKIRNMEIS